MSVYGQTAEEQRLLEASRELHALLYEWSNKLALPLTVALAVGKWMRAYDDTVQG